MATKMVVLPNMQLQYFVSDFDFKSCSFPLAILHDFDPCSARVLRSPNPESTGPWPNARHNVYLEYLISSPDAQTLILSHSSSADCDRCHGSRLEVWTLRDIAWAANS